MGVVEEYSFAVLFIMLNRVVVNFLRLMVKCFIVTIFKAGG